MLCDHLIPNKRPFGNKNITVGIQAQKRTISCWATQRQDKMWYFIPINIFVSVRQSKIV